MTGEHAAVHAAGRTDAGVHALAMAAHVDVTKPLTPHRLREGLNALVRPHPISVLEVEPVADDWHARFSCVGRRYLYRILNRRAPPALDRGRVWHVAVPLDVEAMREGAAHLVGRHDFTTFRSAQCQSDSPVKTLDRLEVTRVGEEIHVDAAARSFLHHQVRSMVGCLALVGRGQWQPEDMKRRWRRATAPRSASTPRPTAFISSKRSTRIPDQVRDDSSGQTSTSLASGRLSHSCGLALSP